MPNKIVYFQRKKVDFFFRSKKFYTINVEFFTFHFYFHNPL